MHVKDIPHIDQLTMSEKILLVEELWDNIAADPVAIPIPESHIAELESRYEKHKAQPSQTANLEELHPQINERL